MTVVELNCARCRCHFTRQAAEFNRQVNRGAKAHFCGVACAREYLLLGMNQWSKADDEFIRQNFGDMTHAKIAEKLGRTKVAVSLRAVKIGCRKGSLHLSDQEQQTIISNRKKKSIFEICKLIGRPCRTVYAYLNRIGIKSDRKRVKDEVEDAVRRSYKDGYNDREISDLVGLHFSTVMKWRRRNRLKANGYTIRSRQRIGNAHRDPRTNYFRTLHAERKKEAIILGWPQANDKVQALILEEIHKNGPQTPEELFSNVAGFRFSRLVNLRSRGVLSSKANLYSLGKGVSKENVANINPQDWEKLVMKLALKHGADRSAVKDSWQYSYGMGGLMRAIQKYDATKGKFSTYAWTWIEGKIKEEWSRRCDAKRQFEESHVPFSEIGTDGDSESFIAVASPEVESPDEAKGELVKLLDILSERERRLINVVKINGMTYKNAGAAELPPITGERVRMIVDSAIKKMQKLASKIKPPLGENQ